MYNDISTKELIKYLIISIFDSNENNPEILAVREELKKRMSLTQPVIV